MVGSPFRRKAPPYAAALLSLSLLILFATYLPVLLTQGGRVLLRGDFVTQQIPFMLEAKRCLLSGTPFWSWNTFLGANFIGTYSFYVYGSPFFWPLLAVPDAWFLHGVTAMFFLKHVTAALGAYLYLARHLENRWYAVAGGLLYAFSFFTLDSTLYYHFLDVIALFPFLLLTLDRVLDRPAGRGSPLYPGGVFAGGHQLLFFCRGFDFLFDLFSDQGALGRRGAPAEAGGLSPRRPAVRLRRAARLLPPPSLRPHPAGDEQGDRGIFLMVQAAGADPADPPAHQGADPAA